MNRALTLWTRDEDARLRDYANQGLSGSKAAALLGRSQPAVWQRAALCGISFHGGKGGAPKGNDNRRIGMARRQEKAPPERGWLG